MGLALAALLAAVVAVGQRARARSAEAQQTSHQLLEALVDRNIARDALERRDALLQTILETMGEGVVASSATGEFLVFNRAARELLGSDGEHGPAAIGEMAHATDPQVWPAGEQTLERALRGESIDDVDICLRRGGREPRWVSVFARPLTLPAGVNGSMLVLRDVTERRLAQERVTEAARELERSNRELTEFASVASHDLRAPLRSVSSFVSLIEEDYGEAFTDEGRTYVGRIKAAVTRMTGLIDGLLALARVRAKGEPFVVVPLAEVVQEVVADLAHSLAESGGAVDVGPLPAIEADRLQMRQLLQNLIGNAIKFRRPGVPPTVRLSAVPLSHGDGDRDLWEIRVADNGIGLEPSHAERIFKPFERLHSHAAFEGSGLGLAVCARIVERHGGRIRAEGQPGAGTTLVVTIPAKHRRREAAA
jgi:PAS domain S-box-containing protein